MAKEPEKIEFDPWGRPLQPESGEFLKTPEEIEAALAETRAWESDDLDAESEDDDLSDLEDGIEEKLADK